ncbi:HSPB1 associated protein 1 [Glossina fuscipes fuscipes]
MDDCSLKVREIVLNTRKPIILRSYKPKWTCFENGIDGWCRNLDRHAHEPVAFECMSAKDSNTPQWERKREIKQMPATDFLKYNCESMWLGLNYKRVHELPSTCSENIDFTCFGFPEAHKDCTFWLSSKNQNTPCHYDTYGCNIVVQIYGKKSWLLFPPSTNLTASRIPYEESSVYCLENFYAPHPKEIPELLQLSEHAYQVVAEPNDILIIPRHWWHYVEALETSLSLNSWIPLDVDVESQIEECIVKYLIENFTRNTSANIKEYVMNPNQLTEIIDDEEVFKILNVLLQEKQSLLSGQKSGSLQTSYSYQYINEEETCNLLRKIENITQIPKLTLADYEKLIKTNSARYHYEEGSSSKPINELQELLIASICSPATVNIIKNNLFKRWEKGSL